MITTLIIIYLISVIACYKIIQLSIKNHDISEFFGMLCPIFNTLFVIAFIIYFFTCEIDWNKFFNKF